MLSATIISRRVKPPSPGSGPSFATADFSRRGDAYNLTRIAAAEHDVLLRRAGGDTVEENARDTLPAAGRDKPVGWTTSPLDGTAGRWEERRGGRESARTGRRRGAASH